MGCGEEGVEGGGKGEVGGGGGGGVIEGSPLSSTNPSSSIQH